MPETPLPITQEPGVSSLAIHTQKALRHEKREHLAFAEVGSWSLGAGEEWVWTAEYPEQQTAQERGTMWAEAGHQGCG